MKALQAPGRVPCPLTPPGVRGTRAGSRAPDLRRGFPAGNTSPLARRLVLRRVGRAQAGEPLRQRDIPGEEARDRRAVMQLAGQDRVGGVLEREPAGDDEGLLILSHVGAVSGWREITGEEDP